MTTQRKLERTDITRAVDREMENLTQIGKDFGRGEMLKAAAEKIVDGFTIAMEAPVSPEGEIGLQDMGKELLRKTLIVLDNDPSIDIKNFASGLRSMARSRRIIE